MRLTGDGRLACWRKPHGIVYCRFTAAQIYRIWQEPWPWWSLIWTHHTDLHETGPLLLIAGTLRRRNIASSQRKYPAVSFEVTDKVVGREWVEVGSAATLTRFVEYPRQQVPRPPSQTVVDRRSVREDMPAAGWLTALGGVSVSDLGPSWQVASWEASAPFSQIRVGVWAQATPGDTSARSMTRLTTFHLCWLQLSVRLWEHLPPPLWFPC